ncbi:MAG: hypothetical protein K5640_05675 [Treponema sp.]|nr:hypothetical protein [Treponema sp.]
MKKILSFLLILFSAVSFVFVQESNGESEKQGKEKVVSVSKGIVRLDFFKKRGTFGVFVVPPENSAKAVLASRNSFSSTGFFLRSRKAIYQLSKDGGIPFVVNTSENGGSIVYTVRKGRVNADVKVSMEICSAIPNETADMIKISVETTNTGTERQTFAIRGIFDTILGELGYTDFSTAQVRRIDEELQFDSMITDRWILSKNAVNALQFLLSGKGITSPKTVTLANKDVVSSGDWDGFYYRAGRPFSSILSYQNSAVDIVWNDFMLAPGQKTSITFYAVLGTEGYEPNGSRFLSGLVEKKAEVEVLPPPAPVTEEPVKEISPLVEEVTEAPVEVSEVPFDASTIKKEQLDPEYVRSLIEKINTLENSDMTVNQEELKRLNAELDVILNALRNM